MNWTKTGYNLSKTGLNLCETCLYLSKACLSLYKTCINLTKKCPNNSKRNLNSSIKYFNLILFNITRLPSLNNWSRISFWILKLVHHSIVNGSIVSNCGWWRPNFGLTFKAFFQQFFIDQFLLYCITKKGQMMTF